jgi:hypothetical protein
MYLVLPVVAGANVPDHSRRYKLKRYKYGTVTSDYRT